MTALLTDNLPLLAGSPNGIKKLRELILELAVRGKLVPQDSSEEPASELLKRIAEEKARLVAEGKIKKQKPLASIAEEEKLFELPMSWVWGRLGEITLKITDGTHHSPTNTPSGDYKYISAKNIKSWGIDLTGVTYVTNEIHQEIFSRCDPSKGDVLYIKDGATTGVATINSLDEPFSMLSSVALLKPSGGLHNEYMLKAIVSPVFYREMRAGMTGVAITRVTLAKLNNAVIPLPPLAEQHRIVAKVDELMALCDRLEAQQTDAESAHAQLVQELLDSLTQASDASDFAANWQRLAEHFDTLFTSEPSIDALKQTLLQLAVVGKLVPQDPSDESASCWLGRIESEKAQLIEAGLLKKTKSALDVGRSEGTPELPDSWRWVTLNAITLGMDSGWSPACEQNPSPKNDIWGVLKTTAVQVMQYRQDENKELPSHLEPRPDAEVKAGDILFTRAGPTNRVGISCLVASTRPKLMISDKIIRFHPVEAGAYGRYIALCLNTGSTARYLESAKSGMAASQVNISQEKLKLAPIPLAPLPEQQRIVAKVDQLMALCDRLKTRLTQARQLNEQLASTLVERALADDRQQAPVTTDQKVARTLLAAEITHRLHSQRTFGQRKLQKVIYLAEHAARLAAVQGNYLRDAAGPHDRQLMNQVENELCNRQWYECVDRETFGHAYRPLSQAGQHRQAYDSAWSTAERATIERVVDLMRDWDTDRCEMTVTLYAAWNDFILEGRPVTDEAIVDEVMHSWNDAKLRFGKNEWLAVLAKMKKQEILTPTGFGQRTTGGMLSLPGFE
ncbi:restriction endonuclease subunit S [Pseudomonas sp. sp1636]|uniref:restriction endonuclease subunit S n=1 Tax=Pseudomonas sp. sp1636 TaxID=3036707 RepID=UPI0025A68DC5|nr:restriction endonuclease subunit S [Pseudomonas sp. sp1636]MDM8347396.1 restriction endonuclease subunit S [Pseudomonas sp. sp1636]